MINDIRLIINGVCLGASLVMVSMNLLAQFSPTLFWVAAFVVVWSSMQIGMALYKAPRAEAGPLEVATESGKPVAIVHSETGDVIAYIPNGKTAKVEQFGVECESCTEHDKQVATWLIGSNKAPFPTKNTSANEY